MQRYDGREPLIRKNYIGDAAIYAAKANALMAPRPEDEIIKGELLHKG